MGFSMLGFYCSNMFILYMALVFSYCQAALLYVVSDTIPYFRENEIIYLFILLFYIYMLLLCTS